MKYLLFLVTKRRCIGLESTHNPVNDIFTLEEHNTLINLLKEGKTKIEIANALGRSYNSVRMKIYNVESGRVNTWTSQELHKLKKLCKSDICIQEMSKILNKPILLIGRIIKELKYKTRRRRRGNHSDKILILSELNNGSSIEDIADKLNYGVFMVIKECKILGIRNEYEQIKTFIDKYENNKSLQFLEYALYNRFKRVRNGSKERDLKFSLKFKNIVDMYNNQNGLCYYTGIKMSLEMGNDDVVSIDRIDSSKDYTLDNIVLCSAQINKMKLDLANDRFFNYCKLINDKHNRN